MDAVLRCSMLAQALAGLVALSGCSGSDGSQATGSGAASSMGGSGGTGATSTASGGGGSPSDVEMPSPVPNECIADVTPGVQTLNCEGLEFILSVPDSCLDEPCGLIMDVHGLGMSGSVQNEHTNMQELAGAAGYIVVQPSGPETPLGPGWQNANDPQLRALMQYVMDAWHVDDRRVHFDGYSMGGGTTWRFICQYSDVIASAAPIAGGLVGMPLSTPCSFAGTDVPSRQIPIFYTHGRLDTLATFDAADESVQKVTAAWYPGVTPEVVAEGPDYRFERWTNPEGNVFEFLQHDWELQGEAANAGVRGHCFPGSAAGLGCGADNAVHWAETVLQFFIDHPMQ